MSIHYTITPSHPEAHLFSVSLEIGSPDPNGQTLSLPTWIPGSYMIRDFARNIVSIEASAQGKAIELIKLDKTTWQLPAGLDQVLVSYDVYAWDLSVRSAHLDATHGFFNGTSVFLAVTGQVEQPCEVTINPPINADTAPPIENWQVATSLPAADCDRDGFGRYRAADYDELIDHPVEMGTFERAVFSACGIEHELVLTGRFRTDMDRICADLVRICEFQIRFFGEPAPVERYVFLVMVVGDGYGGLEHRASTSLLCKREHLPVPGDETVSDKYLEFLGLCSHEYFHTWNVKRIKPARFVPYELAAESYTELLWAFEGITSYYDDIVLVRCGLIDQERYLKLLAKTMTRVQRGAGRLKQSVAESSFDAWTKFYKQDENAPNAIVSYYAKGALIALCLDALIRDKSAGRHSLDDLMRALWQRWLEQPDGVIQADFETLAAELCGEDVGEFFQQAVFGTEPLELAESLQQLGVAVNLRAAESQEDQGGMPTSEEVFDVLSLGARLAPVDGGLRLTHVFDSQPAQQSGLSAGDKLIAVDGLAVTTTSLTDQLKRYLPGDHIQVHVFRRDELIEFSLMLREPPVDTYWLSVQDADKTSRWLDLSHSAKTLSATCSWHPPASVLNLSLDAQVIRAALRKQWAGACAIELHEQLDSTNKYLIRTLDKTVPDHSPVLCVAAHQTAGVGRRGKTWHSPMESITLSLLHRIPKPAAELVGLSLVTGIAIADELQAMVGDPVGLKWPNDLIVSDRKLAGILIEVPAANAQHSSVVTGIGINFRHGQEHQQIDQPFAVLETLSVELPERSELIGHLAGRVLGAYELFIAEGWQAFADRWREYDYLCGKSVRIIRAESGGAENLAADTGVARGVSADGGLIVEHTSGSVVYYGGEVSVRPNGKASPRPNGDRK